MVLRRASWALALSLVASTGCGEGGGNITRRAPRRAVPVVTATVASRPLVYSLAAVGTVEAYQVVTVPARLEGVLEDVAFEEGMTVRPGTILAVVDGQRRRLVREQSEAAEGRARATRDRAAAGVDAAVAKLEEARKNLVRREALAAQKLVPGEELDAARTEVVRLEAEKAVSEATVKEAEAAVREAGARVALDRKEEEDAKVRPPIGGVVESKNATPGKYVKVGEALATIVDTSSLRLRFRVGERESTRIGPDAKVAFRVAALTDREFRAKVLLAGRTADPTTRMVEYLAEVEAPDPALKPGFFAEVTVEIERADARVVVPEEAVLLTEGGFVAYVVEDGRARRRTVVPGLKTREGELEIVSGLANGERLVVQGASALQEGSEVEEGEPEGASPAPPAPATESSAAPASAPALPASSSGTSPR